MRQRFAAILRHHMDGAGISPLALSREVGCSRSYVYALRYGRVPPSARWVVRLADGLQLDGDDRLAFLGAAAWASATPALVALLGDAPMAKVGKLLDRVAR